jgi:DNA-binding PadR family transcriptional regulator
MPLNRVFRNLFSPCFLSSSNPAHFLTFRTPFDSVNRIPKFSLRPIYFFSIVEQMADRSYLGELELMLLLAVIQLGDEAYGVPIARELEKIRGREVSVGSIYASLERLEIKGLVVSTLGDPTPERGGKAKRFFRITKEGLNQVHETRRVLTRLWQKLPEPKLERL